MFKRMGWVQDPDVLDNLVQFLALALCHDGLAGQDGHAGEILPTTDLRDRPGYHLLSGSRA